MKLNLLFILPIIALLSGCETLQTPQQRQVAAAREQAAARHAEEKIYRMQGKVESAEMESARLTAELHQLRREVSAANGNIAQLNSNMKTLEAKQTREMNELIKRVEKLLTKAVSRPAATPTTGAGHEHIVKSGHTLSAIASAYGTTVSAIQKANNLKGTTIRVGQKLFIPE